MFDPTEQKTTAREAHCDLLLRAAIALATEPVCAEDSEVLKERVRSIAEVRSRLDAAELHAIAEIDVRAVTDTQLGLSTAKWFARTSQTQLGKAKKRLKVAIALRESFTDFDKALVEGEIGFDHAVAIVDHTNERVHEQLVAAQPRLLDLVSYCTQVDHWAHQIENLKQTFDEDGSYNPDEDITRNRLHAGRTYDGALEISGQGVGEEALIVEQALELETKRVYRKFRADRKTCPELVIPPMPTLRFLALVEIVRRANCLKVNGKRSRRPRADITFLVEASKPHKAVLPGAARMADNSVRTLLCDAEFEAAIVESVGPGEHVPLDWGRKIRYATEEQFRAVKVRDGGCVFPGCDAPAEWSDMHHIKEWQHNGLSNFLNFALLCRRHHGITHREGWSMRVIRYNGCSPSNKTYRSGGKSDTPPDTPPGDPPDLNDVWFEWTTPFGQVLHSQRRGKLHDSVVGQTAYEYVPLTTEQGSRLLVSSDKVEETIAAQHEIEREIVRRLASDFHLELNSDGFDTEVEPVDLTADRCDELMRTDLRLHADPEVKHVAFNQFVRYLHEQILHERRSVA